MSQTQLTQGIMPMWPSSCCGKLSMEPSGHRTDGGSPNRTGADHLAAHARGSAVSSSGASPLRGVPIYVPYLCPDVAARGAWMGGAESGGRERMLAGMMVRGRKQMVARSSIGAERKVTGRRQDRVISEARARQKGSEKREGTRRKVGGAGESRECDRQSTQADERVGDARGEGAGRGKRPAMTPQKK